MLRKVLSLLIALGLTVPLLIATTAPASGAATWSPTFTLKWGSTGSAPGQFDWPWGIGFDTSGNVYVTDNWNDRVQVFTSTGAFLRAWGSDGTGNGQFGHPGDVAVDSAGRVYVTDRTNDRVQVFTADGTYLSQWGTPGSDPGEFGAVEGIDVDAAGNVYVVDVGNDRVQKFNSNGQFLAEWGSRGSGNGQFQLAQGVAVDDAGNVFVTDPELNRVQRFTVQGTYLGQWGTHGSGDGQFDRPSGVAVDADGMVLVTDQLNNRVQRFTPSGTYLGQWGVGGTGDGGFNGPVDIGVDATGAIYVVDTYHDRIQKFTPPRPALTVVQTVDEDTVAAGSPVHLHLTITNTGNIALHGVAVLDPDVPACAGPLGTLAVGAATTVDCTYETTGADVPSFSNTAAVDTDETDVVESNTVSVWVEPSPSVTITKTADETAVVAGTPIHYHVTVTNPGSVVLSGVTVTDPNAPDCDRSLGELGVGGHHTIDCTYTPTADQTGTYSNTATVDTDQTGALDSNIVDVDVSPAPALSIVKTADETSVVAGDPIHYHLTITNSGDVVLHGVTVTDPNAPDCDRNLGNLAPGAESTVDCGFDTTPADVGLYANTASVDTDETDTIDSNTVDVQIEPRPEITITKSADETSVFPEEPIHYHLTATNTGAVALTGVTVTDPNAPECDRPLGDLGVGGDQTIDCTYTPTADQTGTYTNTATVDTDQTDAVDSNPVDVTVERVRPDAMIARGTGRFLGDDVYGTDGTGQTKRGSVLARGSVTFTVRAENDGTATDDLVVKGSRSTDRFRVTYRVDGDDVTAAVNAGTYQFDAVPPTASRAMTVTVKARAGTPRRASFNARIRVSSPHDLTQRDAVVASVTRV